MNSKKVDLKSGFTQIPNSLILAGGNLTDGEFRLYCVIKCHAFQKSFCFPGRETISKEMGASIAKVDRIKRLAISKGLIGKSRRGQGKTNIYRPKNIFFSEADESSVIPLEDLSVTRKEDIADNTKLNNYPDDRKSKTSNKEKTTNSAPLTKTSNEVIIRSMLNKISKSFIEKGGLEKYDLSEEDLKMAREAIYYYLHKYQELVGIEHPIYRKPQLEDCFYSIVGQVISFRNSSWLAKNIPQVVQMVMDRWFATTPNDPNNLLMSHFIGGKDNKIFDNCFDALSIDEDDSGELKHA